MVVFLLTNSVALQEVGQKRNNNTGYIKVLLSIQRQMISNQKVSLYTVKANEVSNDLTQLKTQLQFLKIRSTKHNSGR